MIKWHVRADQMALLLNRKKRTITRIDKRNVKPGSTIILDCWGRSIPVEVERVVLKKYSELNKEDADSEGFKTLSEFREELTRIYGRRIRKNPTFTVVTFHLR